MEFPSELLGLGGGVEEAVPPFPLSPMIFPTAFPTFEATDSSFGQAPKNLSFDLASLGGTACGVVGSRSHWSKSR